MRWENGAARTAVSLPRAVFTGKGYRTLSVAPGGGVVGGGMC